MTTHEVPRGGPVELEFAIRTTEGGFEVRQADAPGMSDAFVRVSIDDANYPRSPATRLLANGPQFYDRYDTSGANSIQPLPGYTTIEVTAPLLDPTRKAEIAIRLASLIFGLSKSSE